MMLQLFVDRTHGERRVWIAVGAALAVCLAAAPASAQERRAVVFGDLGGASIGHADSEQGKAPIFGGGLAFHLTPHIVLEGDVHGGRVEHVFGRADHDFTQMTMTGSVLSARPHADASISSPGAASRCSARTSSTTNRRSLRWTGPKP